MSLYKTGVREVVDNYLLEESKKVRDYGDYWSASSAGYCMRKNMLERLKVPHVTEDARKQRVFTVGHIFHQFIQELTKKAGISIAQEIELKDDELMILGHADDLVKIDDRLILYDYKSQSSRAFSYKKPEMSYFHKMQLGTYMYMLRTHVTKELPKEIQEAFALHARVSEARICKISKDDLRMSEEVLNWSEDLQNEVLNYWKTLNDYWSKKKFPPCTCAEQEGGFMAKEAYNPFYFQNTPCSLEWYEQCKQKGLLNVKG